MTLINIKNLTIGYGSKIVLKEINLSIKNREIVTIVGPNGSGKTSLFKAIIGTVPLREGTVEVKPNIKIGYVPQKLNIDKTLPITVKRFLSLGRKSKDQAYIPASKITGVESLLEDQMSNLSGGEFQRVLLTNALINQPDILLLDEATQGLDQPGAAAFYRQIETVRRNSNCAILMISHDLHVVMSASDRVICINGHICCAGAPESVASSPEYKALFGSHIDGTLALYRHNHDHKHDVEKESLK
jgi:zinc transport system ATP-binding protein